MIIPDTGTLKFSLQIHPGGQAVLVSVPAPVAMLCDPLGLDGDPWVQRASLAHERNSPCALNHAVPWGGLVRLGEQAPRYPVIPPPPTGTTVSLILTKPHSSVDDGAEAQRPARCGGPNSQQSYC